MRQAVVIQDDALARSFSAYLHSEGIDHELEASDGAFEVWIVREEDVTQARQLYAQFREDPGLQAQFQNQPPAPEHPDPENLNEPPSNELPPDSPFSQEEIDAEEEELEEDEEEPKDESEPNPSRIRVSYPWTKVAILACVGIYFLTAWTSVQNTLSNPNRIFPYWPPVVQALMYDFPPPLQMMVQFDKEYPNAQKNQFDTLDAHALEMIAKIRDAPFWVGFYRMLVYPEHAKELWQAPKFVSIKQGQVYRTVTPIFLHGSILHILFNMLWLYILGRCIEPQMGAWRYLVFMGVTAVVANTIEYLMTGPVFLGYSGVLSAMVGYVWVRQKVAPYEWYPIDRAILIFFMAFIWGFFGIQIVLFALQYLRITAWDLGLGNAAHVSGLLMGMLCARTNLFSKKIT